MFIRPTPSQTTNPSLKTLVRVLFKLKTITRFMDNLFLAVEAFVLGARCTSTTTFGGGLCTDRVGERGH